MKNRIRISIIYCVLFFLTLLGFVIWRNIISQIIAIISFFIMLILLFINLLGTFIMWKKHRYKSLLPLAICLFTVLFSLISIPHIGRKINDTIFAYRKSKYEEVVNMFRRGEIKAPPILQRVELPERFQYLAYIVIAERDNEGQLTIKFLTGLGFPVKHSGYLYCSAGNMTVEFKKRWHIVYRIDDHWFYFSD